VPRPSGLSEQSQRELDELRASIRADLDRRNVAKLPKNDEEVGAAGQGDDAAGFDQGSYRVFKARTVEQHESPFDELKPFDIMDWIDGFSPDDDFAADEREKLEGREVVAWLSRDETDREILMRFASTPDERVKNDPNLGEEEKQHLLAELEDARNVWRDKQIALRRKQLHLRLTEWFGTSKYSHCELVVGWSQHVDSRRFVPTHALALDWIRWTVAERGELSGFASCAAIMKKRLADRKRRQSRRATQAVAF
jgi:hypothetical protein